MEVGDASSSKEHKWDVEYKKGKWEKLALSPIERSRSALLINYYNVYCGKNNGTILDVGCGEGVLVDFLQDKQRPLYTGLDLSKEAIRQAQLKRGGGGVKFNVSSIEAFKSDQKWHMIVFSEVLYYTDHKKVIAQFLPFLHNQGVFAVTSWYKENHEFTTLMTRTIFEDIASVMELVDQVEIKGWSKQSHKNKLKGSNWGEVVWRIGIFRRAGTDIRARTLPPK